MRKYEGLTEKELQGHIRLFRKIVENEMGPNSSGEYLEVNASLISSIVKDISELQREQKIRALKKLLVAFQNINDKAKNQKIKKLL